MIELVFLGTAASAPSVRRGLPATVVLHRDRRFLVDAGEGTQRQILRAGLGFRRLDTVLLTHGHLDHILGLGGIVSTFAHWEATEKMTIHGGAWALQRVRDLLRVVLRGEGIAFEIDLRPLSPGIVLRDGDLEVSAFAVKHRGSGNFGFVFQERDRRPFLVERAEALGVPAGPERRALVEGRDVILADGRVVRPDEVLGPVEAGTKVVMVGDVARIDEVLEPARGADCLVCESTYLWADRDAARHFGHLTARQAATLARDAGVGTLILTHLSRRYPAGEIRREAQAVFPATILADDLQRYEVRRGSVERVQREAEAEDAEG